MQSLSWTGPVNEQAIRDAACDQSLRQAEVMINMAHDRRAVAAVLTPAQVAALPRLEGLEMMRGMPPGPRGTAAVQSGVPFFEYQVEKQARNVSGQQPKYPDELRAAKVEGQVLAQFVVDTTGHVEPATFRVLLSSHALFTQAVRDALPGMQFLPAEVGGRKVRQLVQQPFVFTAPQQD
jgi:TonB family protein